MTPPTSPPTKSPPTVSPPTISPPTQAPPTPKPPPVPLHEELYQQGLKILAEQGKTPEYTVAIAKFKNAGAAGSTKSWFYYGHLKYYGLGVVMDRAAAIEAYRQGEKLKDPLATFALGYLECDGVMQVRNLSRGAARIKTVFAAVERLANEGSPHAKVLLGDAYYDGFGVAVDREKAAQLFRQAALMLDGNAQNHLATCYKEGAGVLQDDKLRLSLLKQSLDRGFKLSLALLGDFYRESKLAAPDLNLAVQHYTQAADLGYAPARLRQATVLNQLKKTEEAEKVYQQARVELLPWAEAGDRRAQYDLASVYMITKQPAKEYEREAVQWLTKAAEQDHPPAQFNLARLLLDGKGVDKPMKMEGMQWLKRAAEQGHEGAIELLKKLTGE
jgi:uncharacterized protein